MLLYVLVYLDILGHHWRVQKLIALVSHKFVTL